MGKKRYFGGAFSYVFSFVYRRRKNKEKEECYSTRKTKLGGISENVLKKYIAVNSTT